jgi:pimeloyl-ACP methyl ester carboxylesterase
MPCIQKQPSRLVVAAGLVVAAAIVLGMLAPAASAKPSAAPLDVAAADSLSARCRGWLRLKMVREADMSCYGLVLEPECEHAEAAQPVVIVVHGYNSCPAKNQAMLRAVHEAGFPCGTFAYPNDYAISASAQLLSSDLRRFARAHPERRVVLLCHSMGGVVARACVEDTLYDPGNVDRLILIAPPNRGTAIAHFAVGTDLWEHWLSRPDGSPWQRVHDSVVDGLGEAANDLCPDSTFLAELNSRPRNPQIHYSIILGTGARMSEAEMNWIRESVVRKLTKLPGAKGGAERLNAMLSDLDELVEGKGDGVVAVARGRLDGVSDTLVLPFGHLSVTGEPASETVRQVQAAVLERLKRERIN